MRPLRLLPLIALASLAFAAEAQAATYCVVNPTCAGTPKSSVQEALDAALLAGPDRIEIGSTVGLLPASGGTYLSSDPLEIQGAGRAATALGGSGTVLSLGLGSSSSSVTVSDLRIVLEPGSGATGLRLDGARARQVDVTADPGAVGAVGVELSNGAAYERGSVFLPGASSVGAWTRLGTSRIDDIVVDLASGSNARGLVAENPSGQTPVILDAQQVTVTGGSISQTGASASSSASGQTVVLNLRSSILSGVGHALGRAAPNGSVNINPTYSNYDPSGNVDAGGVGGITSSPTNTNRDPRFVDAPARDYRLNAASPLIDAGQPGGLEPGEPGVDIAGSRRIIDGNGDCGARRDMGAFEVLPPHATARASAAASGATTNQRISFDGSASCDPDPSAPITSYHWAFDDGHSTTGAVVSHSFGKPGVHSATLTVTSSAGRTGSTTVPLTVGSAPMPASRPRARKRSFVLIKGGTVRVTSKGVVPIVLRCSGTRRCTGRLELTAPKPAARSARRLIVKLGSARFSIRARSSKRIRIRLRGARLRLVTERRRLRAIVTVRDRDDAGRPRKSTRAIVLKPATR